MTIIIDNKDGFTYNLYHSLAQIDADTILLFSDQTSLLEKIKELKPSHIVINFGLGHLKDVKLAVDIITQLGAQIAVLGIGLGHQLINWAFGGDLALDIKHGKCSKINLDQSCPIFKNLPTKINAGNYHSMIIDHLSPKLQAIAYDDNQKIMAIKHKQYNIFGLQFCPSSIMTDYGNQILQNFLEV